MDLYRLFFDFDLDLLNDGLWFFKTFYLDRSLDLDLDLDLDL